MQPLSKELETLSERAKRTESVVDAARTKDREKLAQQRADLDASLAAAGASVSAHRDKASTWWSDMRASVEERFAARHAKSAERRYEHDLKRAQQQADSAEADAADAVELALYLLDGAEQAVIEAVLARAVADDLELEK